jgi:hypothetical protein
MEEITENVVLNIGMESGDDECEDDISTCFPYNRSETNSASEEIV